MKLIIVDANPRALVAKGRPDYAQIFDRVLTGIDSSVRCRRLEPYERAPEAADFDDADGVVFTGSSTDWATDAREAEPQRAAMALAFERGAPCWGSCNGLQLAATILGGAVAASPIGEELGLARAVTPTEAGRAHPMLSGRSAAGFSAPTIHRDEVSRMPEDAVLLATNAHSTVQAFAYRRGGVDFWGAQYHPELSPGDIAAGVRRKGADPALAALLDRSERDPAAAAALGAAPDDLEPGRRMVELKNWIAHVRARQAAETAVAVAEAPA